ncbi:hypothetical protein [Pedobacter steynii]
MISNHESYDLFGKTLLEVLVLKPPFAFEMPTVENACFHYVLENEMQYKIDEKQVNIGAKESVLLNCRTVGNNMSSINTTNQNKLVIVHFHPDILKKIYDREMPMLLQKPKNAISNKTSERINNDFLIQKYIEGLFVLFRKPIFGKRRYFDLEIKGNHHFAFAN